MCTCADVLKFKYRDLIIFFKKLGSELQNVMKKFQSVLKKWTKCRLHFHEVDYFHQVECTGGGYILFMKIKIKCPSGQNLGIMTFRYLKTSVFDKFLKKLQYLMFFLFLKSIISDNCPPFLWFFNFGSHIHSSPIRFRQISNIICSYLVLFLVSALKMFL